jgi:hypothetical protein
MLIRRTRPPRSKNSKEWRRNALLSLTSTWRWVQMKFKSTKCEELTKLWRGSTKPERSSCRRRWLQKGECLLKWLQALEGPSLQWLLAGTQTSSRVDLGKMALKSRRQRAQNISSKILCRLRRLMLSSLINLEVTKLKRGPLPWKAEATSKDLSPLPKDQMIRKPIERSLIFKHK